MTTNGEGHLKYDWSKPEDLERPRDIRVDKTLFRKLAANENGFSHKYTAEKFQEIVLMDVVPRKIAEWNAGKCLAKHTIDKEFPIIHKRLWQEIKKIDECWLQTAGQYSRVINLAMLDEVVQSAAEPKP